MNMEMFEALQRVPATWAHNHRYDTSEREFDANFANVCQTCEERMEDAILEGRACVKHPGALFEKATKEQPSWCELCEDEQKLLAARAQRYVDRLQRETIQHGEAPLPAHMVALARKVYIDSGRENGRIS